MTLTFEFLVACFLLDQHTLENKWPFERSNLQHVSPHPARPPQPANQRPPPRTVIITFDALDFSQPWVEINIASGGDHHDELYVST